MAIEWKPEYGVNIKVIDDQHKKLVLLIDRLYSAISSSKTHEELEPILKELIKYAGYHFSIEKKYFDEFHYEHAQEHEKEHVAFEKKISGLYKKFRNKEMEISFDLIDFLEDWLINHVADQDKKYVKCFVEHGLKLER